MKNVNIFIKVGYDKESMTAAYSYYLNYEKVVVKKIGEISLFEYAYAEIAIAALTAAIESLKEPCNCKVYTEFSIDLDKLNAMSSKAKTLIEKIYSGSHIVKNVPGKNNFKQVDKWEEENKDRLKKSAKIEEEKRLAEHIKANDSDDWRNIYSDLMGPSESTWTPGSGGY
jgi:hypothetical protein